ncbi:MAG: sel1 repeat family protein [Verrucomicrobiales bacterium]|nr:sel1 repeat family protein [Verrucomicrobiales bacterium]
MNTGNHLASYREAVRQLNKGIGSHTPLEWAAKVKQLKAVWAESISALLKGAENGDVEIWHALGNAFERGHGVDRDEEQAKAWYLRSASAGHAISMVTLGCLASRYNPTPEKLAEAIEWYQRAAALGDSGGMISLGFAYREGRGVPVDERRAADWFIKGYHAGAINGAELTGRLLTRRHETHVEALTWLRVAIEHGMDSVYFHLALMHGDRKSPVFDEEEAYRCWIQVAERPRGELRFMAMLALARSCRDGIGTERSRGNAIRWLDRLMAAAPVTTADYRNAVRLKEEIEGELF